MPLLLLRGEHARAGIFAEAREHRFRPHEGRRHHKLIAENEAVEVEVVAVDLPAPRLIRRRIAEDADPVEPLAVFLGLAGDLQRVLVQPHDVARAAVARLAHAFPQQGKCGLALIVAQIGEADAVAHHPRMDVAPHPPRLVADRERCRLALRRGERGEEGARGFAARARARYRSFRWRTVPLQSRHPTQCRGRVRQAPPSRDRASAAAAAAIRTAGPPASAPGAVGRNALTHLPCSIPPNSIRLSSRSNAAMLACGNAIRLRHQRPSAKMLGGEISGGGEGWATSRQRRSGSDKWPR